MLARRLARIGCMSSVLMIACSDPGADQGEELAAEPEESSSFVSSGDEDAEEDDRGEPPQVEEAAPAADEDAPDILRAHNRYRARHCAPPLRWSAELARVAQAWANRLRARGCAFDHSGTSLGENLAGGTSGTLTGEGVAEIWYREARHYDFRRPRFSMQSGHFTQLVWVGSQRLGCGKTECNGMDIWVCNYDPPGNVHGDYERNVLPVSCRRR